MQPKNLTRGRTLGAIALLILIALISSGQSWYQIAMAPNDQQVVIQEFDAYTTYPWISPLLLVCLLALAVTALTVGITRTAALSLGLAGSALLSFLSISAISSQDLTGLSDELEKATGIAATHGIKDLQIQTLHSPWFSLAAYCLIAILFGITIYLQRNWRTKVRPSAARPKKATSLDLKDSISLWDEQR